MTEWATQVREAYRRLQRAMARQRADMEQRFGPKRAARSTTASISPSRQRSDVTSPGPGSPVRSALRGLPRDRMPPDEPSAFGVDEPRGRTREDDPLR